MSHVADLLASHFDFRGAWFWEGNTVRADCGAVWVYSPVNRRLAEKRSAVQFAKKQGTRRNHGKGATYSFCEWYISSLLHFFSIKPVAFYLMLLFPLKVIEFTVRKVSVEITTVSKRDTFKDLSYI